MRRFLALVILIGLATTVSLPAHTNHLDLKGKQIKLAILGVAGWLPSKLPSDMFPEFAQYAKEKFGYDVTCSYADAPFGALFQKAAASLATKSNEYSLIVSDSQWLGAFTEPGWIVKLDPIIKSDPALSKLKWYDPVLETSYMEYPDNSGQHVALPQETDVQALFVRKDLFQDQAERDAYKQQTGHDLPQTFEDWEKVDFEEFAKIGKFFTRPGKNLYGTVFQHSKE
jgi:multiple sugar transport system substrate-binding protein